MSNTAIPFQAQTAVLDRYVHKVRIDTAAPAISTIIRVLQAHQELRDYFFSRGPSAAWAPVLWEKGFFTTPATSEEQQVRMLWDVQSYLIMVAQDASDIVLRHVRSVERPPAVVKRALQALCRIPAQEIIAVLPRLTAWLEDPSFGAVVAAELWETMVVLARADHMAEAFMLFRSLTRPMVANQGRGRDGLHAPVQELASSRVPARLDPALSVSLRLLTEKDTTQVIAALEEHLRVAEELVMTPRDHGAMSWWRSAIEDTGQDLHDTYRDWLLATLRDSLEDWISRDASAAEPTVARYLTDTHAILRRLSIHLLRRFPTHYHSLISRVLVDDRYLNDFDLHHEYFLLLQQGYTHLTPPDQEKLVQAILNGPPPDTARSLAEWVQHAYGEEPDAYMERHTKVWIRDRLWMVQSLLDGRPAAVLRELLSEAGPPNHPEFTHHSTGGWVEEVGPLTDEEIADLSPDQLLAFIKRWQPRPQTSPTLRQESYSGLAGAVARVLIADLRRYGDSLLPLARHRPEYAYALIDLFTKNAKVNNVPWDHVIALCDQLLVDEEVRVDNKRGYSGGWSGVRLAIVHLLEMGLEPSNHAMPRDDLERVQNILLALVDDPDPDRASDRPAEGWAGHNDPATVALNHVRPMVLLALLTCAVQRAEVTLAESPGEARGPGPARLDPLLRAILERKLERTLEPSRGVRSIYGRCLYLLYWLDQHWTETTINRIMPLDSDDESVQLFVAAWDSYVIFNPLYINMLPLLRTRYERAIDNVSQGWITKTHLEPERRLAEHLVLVYLHVETESSFAPDSANLIALYYRKGTAEARGRAAWVLWRFCEDNKTKLDRFWLKVRALWEWRMHEAIAADHSVDFDAEMEWFALLLPVAAGRETIISLWPLAEGLIPHVTRSGQRSMGRDAIETYVGLEVERDPVRAIQLYRLLCEHSEPPMWYSATNERRIILEKAAADARSRDQALALIDSIVRRGDYGSRDIYERYAT